MHKALLLALAALAAAAPRPLLGLDLPVLDTTLPSDVTKDIPVLSEVLTEVEGLAKLELPVDTKNLPEVEKLLAELEKLIHLELPLDLELPEIRSVLTEVESIVGGDGLPPLTELLSKVEALIASLLDVDALHDLPSVQDLLLEIDGLTEGLSLKTRGLIVDVENAGIDLLNSQDVVPLENTLSEFNKEPTPSGSKSAPEPSASKWPAKGEGKGTAYVSTFDDLTPLIGQVAVQEVGPYNGLDYNGIDLVQLGVFGTIVTGIVPKTAPNAGAYGLTTNLLNGAPNITAKYQGSVTESFDFNSFYFGCVKGTVETIASEPLSCNVTVTGYKHEKAVAEQTFVFTYNLLVDGVTKNMTEAVLPKTFKDLDTATFTTSYDVSNAIGATLIDSLKYITYTKKDAKAGDGGEKGGSEAPKKFAELPAQWQ